MNHSLVTAGATTHLRIVIVALIGAILVVTAGIAGHAEANRAPAPVVVKVGKASTYSSHDGSTVR